MAIFSPSTAFPLCHTMDPYALRWSSPPIRSSSPDLNTIQKLIRNVFKNSIGVVHRVERLPSQFHRLYLVQTIDGRTTVIKCMPGQRRHTLRHEQHALETESRMLSLVASNTNVPVATKFRYDPDNRNPLQSPLIVRDYLPGTPLTVISSRLSVQERATVDRAIALHLRQLSSLAAPTFGSTWRVFGEGGSSTWREAFLGMLESALRDCEDLMLTVPYDAIRQLASQHAILLDEISEARLVVLDAGLERNILIDETNHAVVGLLGLANVVWGDPFMGSVFFQASDAFWQAFGSAARAMPGHQGRMLLYAMYRSIVSISEAHIRPQGGDEDAVARRTLTWALNQLSRS